MTVLFDTNVILDVLLKRSPHDQPAVQLFAAVENGMLSGMISASSVTTIHYLAAKVIGPAAARLQIRNLVKIFDVAPVNRAVLEGALNSKFHDYEDAVQHEAARQSQADGIVTRDPKDFKHATLRIFAPDELRRMLCSISDAESPG